MIKVCIRPGCDAVYHCVTDETVCPNCDMRLVKINMHLYEKKFQYEPCQFDIKTMMYYDPTKDTQQMRLI